MRTGLITALVALAMPSIAHPQAVAQEEAAAYRQAVPSASTQRAAAQPISPRVAAGERLLSLDEAKQQYRGKLSRVVLDFLTVMDRIVNKDKQPPITTADWAPLGQLINQEKFRRVGNFGVRNDWPSYAKLLTQWANSSWWKGYIWRMREVPASAGQPALVYLETQERSSQKHPVRDDGDYSTLASIAVYEIDSQNKITALHVYDQRPR